LDVDFVIGILLFAGFGCAIPANAGFQYKWIVVFVVIRAVGGDKCF